MKLLGIMMMGLLLVFSAAGLQAVRADESEEAYKTRLKYERGNGVTRDYTEAFKWYQKAANRGMVNILDFGAKADMRTDDTKAIQAALNYLATKDGGQLYFPPRGSVVINGTVTIPNRLITLMFQGCCIYNGNLNGPAFLAQNVNAIAFRDGSFACMPGMSVYPQCHIQIINVGTVELSNMCFSNATAQVDMTYTWIADIHDCSFHEAAKSGCDQQTALSFHYCNGVTVQNCNFEPVTNCIKIVNGGLYIISKNWFENHGKTAGGTYYPTGIAIYVDNDQSTDPTVETENIRISENAFQGSDGEAQIVINSAKDIVIEKNNFYMPRSGIAISAHADSYNLVIDKNSFIDQGSSGMIKSLNDTTIVTSTNIFYGPISTLSLANGGSGYSVNDMLTISEGTFGIIKVTGVSNGVVTGIQLINGGRRYTPGTKTTKAYGIGCTVNIDSVNSSGGVTEITSIPTSGGQGYMVGQVLTLGKPYTTKEGGSGATVTVSNVSNGTVTGVTLTSAGSGYSTNTTVQTICTPFSGRSGCTVIVTGVKATPFCSGSLRKTKIINNSTFAVDDDGKK
ncbi:MAG: glycosyl hydrolase family 28-related protein [Desulfomonilaceae bacterium]